MPPVDNVNIIRVRGYLQYQDGSPIPRQRVVSVPVSSTGNAVLQVTDISSGLFVALKATSTLPNQTTGYFYVDLVASNDPDLAPHFLWAITVGQAAPVLVTVPYDAPTSVVDGGSRQAVWLADLPVVTTPTPLGLAYYTSSQTDAAIAEAIVASGGGGSTPDATTSVKGKLRLAGDLGGTADSPTVPGLTSKADATALAAHTADTGNPHSVTKAQIGLGSADNTSDASKPLSSAATTALAGKAATSHSHAESDVTNLTTDLAGKAASVHTHAESDVTSLVSDLAAKQPLDSDLTTIAGLTATTNNIIQSVGSAWASRTPAQVKAALAIAESDVTNLVTDLAGKAASTHTHAESDVTSLVSDLAAKQPLDSDLTTIAGLTATTDSFLQSKASAWTTRTVAQVKTDLAVPTVPGDIGAQPVDSDLTTIAGLTATTDNVIQSVAGAWASRTPAQLKTALAIAESDVTNLVTDLAAKIPKSLVTAKGDVVTASGSGVPVALPVSGNNGWVLTEDSAQTNGIKWAASAGGGSGDLPEFATSAQTSAVSTPSTMVGKITRYDTTGGAINQTLPAATAGAVFGIGWDAGTAALTFTAAGSDVIGSGSTTSFVMPLAGEVLTYHCTTAGRWRSVSGLKPQSSLAAVFAPANTRTVVTSEALSAGDWVNLWASTGLKARKADATATGKRAHGFVLAAVGSGGTATVYTAGINTAVTGATAGGDAFLSTTAGGYTSTAPSGSGNVVQYLGPILSATEIAFEPTIPMVLA